MINYFFNLSLVVMLSVVLGACSGDYAINNSKNANLNAKFLSNDEYRTLITINGDTDFAAGADVLDKAVHKYYKSSYIGLLQKHNQTVMVDIYYNHNKTNLNKKIQEAINFYTNIMVSNYEDLFTQESFHFASYDYRYSDSFIIIFRVK